MAKKKVNGVDVEDEGKEETGDLNSKLSKEWKGKFLSGGELQDNSLISISTSSIKLDWALGGLYEGSIVELYGDNATGKAQPLDAEIMTPDGIKLNKNLKIGDKVLTPDGGQSEIIGIFPQGVIDTYKVSFSDGTSTECSGDHLWYTETLLDRAKKRKGKVKTTLDISKTLERQSKGIKALNHKIPVTKPVSFNKKNLLVKPYLLGALLGDGNLCGTSIEITGEDKDILAACAAAVPENISLNKNPKSNTITYIFKRINNTGGNSIKDELRNELKISIKKLGLLNADCFTKFIPNEYLFSSIEDRLELLQGLLDTDGYIGETGIIEYSTSSSKLAEQSAFLVRSLGGKVSIQSRYPTYHYKGEKKTGALSYRVTIRMPQGSNPFKLTRKLDIFNKTNKYYPVKFITNVEYIGQKNSQCILIDHPDHLYMTNDFIVTHNTTFAMEVASNAIKLGKKVYYVDLERKLREAQINMIRDLDKTGLSIMYPDTAEEALNMMEEVVRSVPGCVVILDSVSGLLPEVEDAEDASKVTMGTVAKFCAKMIRKLTGIACKNKCLLLFLNHKTASMQMYGPSDTVHGGKAISNRASQRIELSRTMGQLIKGADGETVIGQVVKCKVVKNNVKRPFITVEVPIIYGQGIARELDIFEFAVELNVIDGTKKGWYGWKDQSFRKDEVLLKLLQDEAFKKEVVNEIKKVMN